MVILNLCPLPLLAGDKEFGSTEYAGEALIGILYDFKQTQQHVNVPMNIEAYYKAIEEFTNNRWDESVLRKYFRSPRALYTTDIFISQRPASAGPAAFGVEKIVKPSYWMAHYKGQVIPPKPGRYEFVASADGFIAIAVNGQTILVKHASNSDKYQKQLGGLFEGNAVGSKLRHSLPFESDGKTPLDLDIALAEAGGLFNAFLMYCREGDSYPSDGKGGRLYPVFQLAPRELPRLGTDKAPAFEQRGEYWRSLQ